MADAVKQALLLSKDMAELLSMRRHEVFLRLKRYLAMVCIPLSPFFLFSFYYFPLLLFLIYLFPQQAVQASFWVEEITNYCHRQMKEEEGRHNATIKAFNVAEKSIQELNNKLLEEEKERKNATTALDGAERQAEG